jgi:cytochrome c biogenesis protein CcmG, thiol:disulfide interchange protein DsbE
MRRRLLVQGIALVALITVLVIGLTQASRNDDSGGDAAKPFDLGTTKRDLAGAPAPLASLYAQSNQVLGGGRKAFDARLATLRGHPVVVNKWASWCLPCRGEFPIFQQVAAERGKQVAFVGLDAKDKTPAAKKFLATRPLPYPSYEDPDQSLSGSLSAPQVAPVTVFIDARGKVAFMHSGQYTSADELTKDIDRYLVR